MEADLEPFRNTSLLHYTDSRAAESIVTFGSRNPDIHFMVVEIILKAREFGIQMAAKWISREDPERQIADAGSRGPWFPAQEFSLDASTMAMVLANYNITLDVMASHQNNVVARYFSLAFKPEALGRNSFEQSIGTGEFLWFFPPPGLLWSCF